MAGEVILPKTLYVLGVPPPEEAASSAPTMEEAGFFTKHLFGMIFFIQAGMYHPVYAFVLGNTVSVLCYA